MDIEEFIILHGILLPQLTPPHKIYRTIWIKKIKKIYSI